MYRTAPLLATETDPERDPLQPEQPEQPEQPAPEVPEQPQPSTDSRLDRLPDGSYRLILPIAPDAIVGVLDREQELRRVTRAVARSLASLGGENCPSQIGEKMGTWAAEAIAGI